MYFYTYIHLDVITDATGDDNSGDDIKGDNTEGKNTKVHISCINTDCVYPPLNPTVGRVSQ